MGSDGIVSRLYPMYPCNWKQVYWIQVGTNRGELVQ